MPSVSSTTSSFFFFTFPKVFFCSRHRQETFVYHSWGSKLHTVIQTHKRVQIQTDTDKSGRLKQGDSTVNRRCSYWCLRETMSSQIGAIVSANALIGRFLKQPKNELVYLFLFAFFVHIFIRFNPMLTYCCFFGSSSVNKCSSYRNCTVCYLFHHWSWSYVSHSFPTQEKNKHYCYYNRKIIYFLLKIWKSTIQIL